MYDLFLIIWNIAFSAVSDWFITSDFALLIYLFLISAVACYFIRLVRLIRRY